MDEARGEVIKDYFESGFSYEEIQSLLESRHGVTISVRQLHRVLRKNGLFKRKNKSPLNHIFNFIIKELQGSSSHFGYRMMHQKARQNGYVVDRETVRLALKALDPEGVKLRKKKRLKRRIYHSVGPNYAWHVDGYDKLKPFGISIHGAIDGYSRKILWLNADSTNNDPKIVAKYFVTCLNDLNLVPRKVRTDRGSENIVIAGIQRFLRRFHQDSASAKESFKYGKSTSNQRIEAWWSFFRRSRMNWWINFCKDLEETTDFDPGIDYHIDCFRFCFLSVIQTELDETKKLWNSHRIRDVSNSECPGGRPDVLYFAPHRSGGRDCKFPLVQSDLQLAKEHCAETLNFGCSNEFLQCARIIMHQYQITTPPVNLAEAQELFETLLDEIDV